MEAFLNDYGLVWVGPDEGTEDAQREPEKTETSTAGFKLPQLKGAESFKPTENVNFKPVENFNSKETKSVENQQIGLHVRSNDDYRSETSHQYSNDR